MNADEDVLLVLDALGGDELNDHEADVLLQRWRGERTEEELLAACYAVLTSTCSPLRMGATVKAVRLAVRTRPGTAWLWERLEREYEPGKLSEAQMTNWVAGFYYLRFDLETYARFVRMASLAMRKYDRLSIAIMLSTWSGLGDQVAEVTAYIEKLTEENRAA
jgi:hypothetical protein